MEPKPSAKTEVSAFREPQLPSFLNVWLSCLSQVLKFPHPDEDSCPLHFTNIICPTTQEPHATAFLSF